MATKETSMPSGKLFTYPHPIRTLTDADRTAAILNIFDTGSTHPGQECLTRPLYYVKLACEPPSTSKVKSSDTPSKGHVDCDGAKTTGQVQNDTKTPEADQDSTHGSTTDAHSCDERHSAERSTDERRSDGRFSNGVSSDDRCYDGDCSDQNSADDGKTDASETMAPVINTSNAAVQHANGADSNGSTAENIINVDANTIGSFYHLMSFEQPLGRPLDEFKNSFLSHSSPGDWQFICKVIIRDVLHAFSLMHANRVVATDFSAKQVFVQYQEATLSRRIIAQVAPFEHAHVEGTPLRIELDDFTVYSPELRMGVPVHAATDDDLCPLVNTPTDIWNLANFVFELVTGQPLLVGCLREADTQWQANLQCLAEMTAVSGPIPPSMKSDLHCTLESELDGRDFFESANPCGWYPLFETERMIHLCSLFQFKETTAIMFLQFIWKMLRMSPDDRATADELLNDPWLCSGDTDAVGMSEGETAVLHDWFAQRHAEAKVYFRAAVETTF